MAEEGGEIKLLTTATAAVDQRAYKGSLLYVKHTLESFQTVTVQSDTNTALDAGFSGNIGNSRRVFKTFDGVPSAARCTLTVEVWRSDFGDSTKFVEYTLANNKAAHGVCQTDQQPWSNGGWYRCIDKTDVGGPNGAGEIAVETAVSSAVGGAIKARYTLGCTQVGVAYSDDTAEFYTEGAGVLGRRMQTAGGSVITQGADPHRAEYVFEDAPVGGEWRNVMTTEVYQTDYDDSDAEYVIGTTANGAFVHHACRPDQKFADDRGFFTCAKDVPMPYDSTHSYVLTTTATAAVDEGGVEGSHLNVEYLIECEGGCAPPAPPSPPPEPPFRLSCGSWGDPHIVMCGTHLDKAADRKYDYMALGTYKMLHAPAAEINIDTFQAPLLNIRRLASNIAWAGQFKDLHVFQRAERLTVTNSTTSEVIFDSDGSTLGERAVLGHMTIVRGQSLRKKTGKMMGLWSLFLPDATQVEVVTFPMPEMQDGVAVGVWVKIQPHLLEDSTAHAAQVRRGAGGGRRQLRPPPQRRPPPRGERAVRDRRRVVRLVPPPPPPPAPERPARMRRRRLCDGVVGDGALQLR